ncbi:MAG TPA: hypothetical protein VFG71_10785 [Nitrospiraceae bacterium]|nr:hypothetical protein [Nitrospiraceae bacterium]
MTAAGLAISIPLVLDGSHYLKSFLYGVPANDPTTVVASLVLLLAAALGASYVPAMRTSRIDPLRALRSE